MPDMAHQYKKHYTLTEARAKLPWLRKAFAEIHTLFADLSVLTAEFVRAQAVVKMNGHAPKPVSIAKPTLALQKLLKDIEAASIEIKDIERGLVDFPHLREGEEVFLCWELSEEDIHFWHAIDEGFAGRRSL